MLTLVGNHHYTYKPDTYIIIKITTFAICLLKLIYHFLTLLLLSTSFGMYGPSQSLGAELTSFTYTIKMMVNSIILIYIFYWKKGFVVFLQLWVEIRSKSEKKAYSKLARKIWLIIILLIVMVIFLLGATFYFNYFRLRYDYFYFYKRDYIFKESYIPLWVSGITSREKSHPYGHILLFMHCFNIMT